MSSRRSMPPTLSKSDKAQAGRTGPARTPLDLRVVGLEPDWIESEPYIRERAGRKLAKFAYHTERVTVRFRDHSGPRGGLAIACQVRLVLSGAPSVVVEHVASTPREAFDSAVDAAGRTARRATRRRGWRTERVDDGLAPPPKGPPPDGAGARLAPEDGSLICRRVGRSAENLARAAARPEKRRRDVPVDTAAPGRSATDRKAGGSSTAARNTRLNDSRATSALEDSARDRPSRKSTRRSVHRSKRDAPQRIAEVVSSQAPAERARRADARQR